MNIEAALTKRIGAAGAKLHTASSFDVYIVNVFDVRRSLAERRAIGAPSPENVAVQICAGEASSSTGRARRN